MALEEMVSCIAQTIVPRMAKMPKFFTASLLFNFVFIFVLFFIFVLSGFPGSGSPRNRQLSVRHYQEILPAIATRF
jgi:hypothetical protein